MTDINDKSWYLITSKPHKDAYAEEQLSNQGYEVYRPLAKRLRTRGRKKVELIESLFPRYLFIKMHTGIDDWGPIRSTRGVQGVVKFGTRPAKVDNYIINELREKEEQHGQKIIDLDRFNAGQVVEINGGPFDGLNGIFDCYDGEQRVIILLEMLGNVTPLKLDGKFIAPL